MCLKKTASKLWPTVYLVEGDAYRPVIGNVCKWKCISHTGSVSPVAHGKVVLERAQHQRNVCYYQWNPFHAAHIQIMPKIQTKVDKNSNFFCSQYTFLAHTEVYARNNKFCLSSALVPVRLSQNNTPCRGGFTGANPLILTCKRNPTSIRHSEKSSPNTTIPALITYLWNRAADGCCTRTRKFFNEAQEHDW
jgi:hypothetical protein